MRCACTRTLCMLCIARRPCAPNVWEQEKDPCMSALPPHLACVLAPPCARFHHLLDKMMCSAGPGLYRAWPEGRWAQPGMMWCFLVLVRATAHQTGGHGRPCRISSVAPCVDPAECSLHGHRHNSLQSFKGRHNGHAVSTLSWAAIACLQAPSWSAGASASVSAPHTQLQYCGPPVVVP